MTYPILVNFLLFLEIQAGRTNSGFPKIYLVWYFFVFAQYVCKCSPKMRIKNYISILAINCKLPKLAGCFTPFKLSYCQKWFEQVDKNVNDEKANLYILFRFPWDWWNNCRNDAISLRVVGFLNVLRSNQAFAFHRERLAWQFDGWELRII